MELIDGVITSEGDKFTLATPISISGVGYPSEHPLLKRLLRLGDVLLGVCLLLSRSCAHTGCPF